MKQIMKEVSKEHENYRYKIKHNSPGAYEVLSSLPSPIATLHSEIYLLGDEFKEKHPN